MFLVLGFKSPRQLIQLCINFNAGLNYYDRDPVSLSPVLATHPQVQVFLLIAPKISCFFVFSGEERVSSWQQPAKIWD